MGTFVLVSKGGLNQRDVSPCRKSQAKTQVALQLFQLNRAPALEGLPAHGARGRRVDLLGRWHALVRRLHVQLEALPRQQPLAALVAEEVEGAATAVCLVAPAHRSTHD